MKKVLKIAGSALGVLALVVLGLVGFVMSQMSKNQGDHVDAGGKAFGSLTGIAYAWVVPTPHGAFVVDTGDDEQGTALLAELNAHHVEPANVHTILITHAHGDHTKAAHLFPNAQVICGPGEGPFMRGEAHLGPKMFAGMQKPVPVPPKLREASDGEMLDLDGVAVRVVHVPGHTPGSAMYLMGDILFTGDSLMWRKDKLQMGPNFFSESVDQNRASLKKLLEIPAFSTADGHAGFTRDARTALQAFLSEP